LPFDFSGVGSETGSDGREMVSMGTAGGTGTGAGTIAGMGTIAGAATGVTAGGILTNDGSGGDRAIRDDRVMIGSGDTGSGAG